VVYLLSLLTAQFRVVIRGDKIVALNSLAYPEYFLGIDNGITKGIKVHILYIFIKVTEVYEVNDREREDRMDEYIAFFLLRLLWTEPDLRSIEMQKKVRDQYPLIRA
jgi:hypothetical protein